MIQRVLKSIFGEIFYDKINAKNDLAQDNAKVIDFYLKLDDLKKEIQETGTIKEKSIADLENKINLLKKSKNNRK